MSAERIEWKEWTKRNESKKRKWASNHVSTARTHTHAQKEKLIDFSSLHLPFQLFFLSIVTPVSFSPLTSRHAFSLSFSMAFFLGAHTIESNVILPLLLPVCARFHYHLQPCFKSILSPFTLDSMALLLMLDSTSARRAFTIQGTRAHTHTHEKKCWSQSKKCERKTNERVSTVVVVAAAATTRENTSATYPTILS